MKVLKVPVETDINKLHVKSVDVNLKDTRSVSSVEQALLRTFDKLEGKAQGLAAIQCGYAVRAVLLRYVKGVEPTIIFNPKVLNSFGRKSSIEGCLSEGSARYLVKRPLLIKVEYYDKYEHRFVKWLSYKKARIFMHEYDHLDGVLLQDKGQVVEV